ncbi:MAG: 50S ribosomal protein L21 [Deltaproteobacteria bacterium]|nr:50S ribosomal protein L21 [Deltaproteobacteria bacterium]
MYAVFVTGGQQFKAKVGDTLKIEKIEGEVGQTVNFDQVLMVRSDDACRIGAPFVNGAKVESEILEQERRPKVYVVKYKRRKGYQKKNGHRQYYTKIRVKSIAG